MRTNLLQCSATSIETFLPVARAVKRAEGHKAAVIGFIGRSGAGKTTAITDVVNCLRRDGFTVSAIKRVHDGFDLDRPGKDSWRLREAGCNEVLLASDRRWVLLHERGDGAGPEPDPLVLVRRMAPTDIVVFEGFRHALIPMIEVHRPSLAYSMLWPSHPTVIAVATDAEVDCPLPLLNLGAPREIADFVIARLGLRARSSVCCGSAVDHAHGAVGPIGQDVIRPVSPPSLIGTQEHSP